MLINKMAMARWLARGFPIVLADDSAKMHLQEQIINWANNISANVWAYESIIAPHGVMLAPGNGSPFIHVMLEDDAVVMHFFDEVDDLMPLERTQIAGVCQGLFVFLVAYTMMNNSSAMNTIEIGGKPIVDKDQRKYIV